MNPKLLSAALILSTTLLSSALVAQSRAVPEKGVVVESPEPVAKKLPPIVEEGRVEESRSVVPAGVMPLRIDVRQLEHGGIRLDIAKADEAGGHLFLVIFAGVCDDEMVPIAVLDASTQDMRSFPVELDVFAGLPIGLMAVRVGSDGVTEVGPLETAPVIASRLGR